MKSFLAQAAFAVAWHSVLSESSYSFVTLGDWGGEVLGGYHAVDVKKVAAQLGKTAASNDAKFLINTGDNFYYCGITSTSDAQITEDYLSIYNSSSLQVPWYSSLGNHEYGYNVDAQVQFTKVDPSKRWYLPSRYYNKRILLAGQQYATLIVLDTNPCIKQYRSEDSSGWDPCGSDFPSCDPVKEGPCKFHENIIAQDCDTQFQWLKAQLSKVDKNDWLIVVAHHPADEIDVADMTSSIMDHGFDLYLNGHVHNLEQYTIGNRGAFVTSGAGAMVKTPDQENHARCQASEKQTVWEQKIAGFTLHTFSEDFKQLKTDFISYTGEVLKSFTVTKGAGPTPGPGPGPSPPGPSPPGPSPPGPSPPGPSPPSPGSCSGHWPCKDGCTYIHKKSESACNVAKFGCYKCASLPKGCPDCKHHDSEDVIAI